MNTAEVLWRRAFRAKRLGINRTRASALALGSILRRAGQTVSIHEIRAWPRALQGRAYLWAVDRLDGVENVPPPWIE